MWCMEMLIFGGKKIVESFRREAKNQEVELVFEPATGKELYSYPAIGGMLPRSPTRVDLASIVFHESI